MHIKFSRQRVLIFALLFGIIGAYVIFHSSASTSANLAYGDLNSDNKVDVTDLSILLSNYTTNNASADINSDGTVNIIDLSILLSHFGTAVPAAGAANITGYGVSIPCDRICYETATNKDAEFADIAATGATWVRIDLRWSVIENTGPTGTNWASFDDTVTRASAHGLKVLPILHSTPSWANGGQAGGVPPTNIQDWKNFIAKAVNHQKANLHYWEIWNEENGGSFFSGTVAQYTQLLIAAYDTIKANDPTAMVMTGGFVPCGGTTSDPCQPQNYLNSIYANGGGGHFDIVATHPYPSGDGDSNGTNAWNGWRQMKDSYQVMVNHGDASKKIWGTEYGYNLTGYLPASSESSIQTKMTTDINNWKTYSWHGVLFWYTDRDDNVTGEFGLSGPNYPLVHRPRWATWQSDIR
jgi:hypothetical protein